MDDLELIRRCAQGDQESRQLLVRTYSPVVVSAIRYTFSLYAAQLCSRQDVLQDLCHEIFLKLFDQGCKRLLTFTGAYGASLSGWLRHVAANRAVDHLRRMRPHLSLDQAIGEGFTVADLIPDPQESVLTAAERLEERQQLAECIAQLDTLSLFIIRANVFAGVCARELALLLGISRGAFDMRKSRIMEKLRECFRKKGFL
jgi:RNA polymerase sigma factor (sigma-70 family)